MAEPKPEPTAPKKPNKRTGRTPRLTPVVRDAIVKAVSLGLPWTSEPVARVANVSPRTLRLWVKNGREAKSGVYRDLYVALTAAEQSAIQRSLETIQKAAAEREVVETKETRRPDGTVVTVTTRRTEFTWTAAAWYLERTLPDVFGRNRVELEDLWKLVRQVMKGQGNGDDDTGAAQSGVPQVAKGGSGKGDPQPDAGPAPLGPDPPVLGDGDDPGPVAGPVPLFG